MVEAVVGLDEARVSYETHLSPARTPDGDLSWMPAWRLSCR